MKKLLFSFLLIAASFIAKAQDYMAYIISGKFIDGCYEKTLTQYPANSEKEMYENIARVRKNYIDPAVYPYKKGQSVVVYTYF